MTDSLKKKILEHFYTIQEFCFKSQGLMLCCFIFLLKLVLGLANFPSSCIAMLLWNTKHTFQIPTKPSQLIASLPPCLRGCLSGSRKKLEKVVCWVRFPSPGGLHVNVNCKGFPSSLQCISATGYIQPNEKQACHLQRPTDSAMLQQLSYYN